MKELNRTYLRNMVLISLLLFIIFGSMFWNFYAYLGDKGIVKQFHAREFYNLMMRERAWYTLPIDEDFFSGFAQKQLELAASDHFPLPLLLSYISAKRFLSGFFINVFPISWVPVRPVGGDILSLREEKRLVSIPQLYFPKEINYLLERSDFYNSIAKRNPQIRLVVFPVISAEGWLPAFNSFWNGSQNILAGDKWVIKFEKLLSSEVYYSWPFRGLPPHEAITNFYLTDHHFTMPGAYKVYCQLLEILKSETDSGYHPIKPVKWFDVPNVNFRGGHARRAGEFDGFYDVLQDAEFNLPPLEVEINESKGLQGTTPPMRDKYLHGNVPKGKFVWHYGNYYGDNYGLIKYTCLSAPKRNLLVLGDSFDNCITALLGSHYNQSFFIDLRHYSDMVGKEFVFDDFVKEHEINHVLFLGRHQRILGFTPLNH